MSYKVDEARSNRVETTTTTTSDLNDVRVNEGRRSLNKYAQWCVTDDVLLGLHQQQKQHCGPYRWRIVERRRLGGLLGLTQLSPAVQLPTTRRRRWCPGLRLVIAVVSSPSFQLDAPRETDHSPSRFALGRFYSLLTIYHHTTVCCPRPAVTWWGLAAITAIYTVFQKKVHPCDFHDNNVKWKPIWIIFGKNVACEIRNKTVWNKCQIYSLSSANLSFKMRFIFFILQQWNVETSRFRELLWLQ